MKKTILVTILLFLIGCVQAKPDRAVEVVLNQKRDISSIFGNYYALLIYVDDYTHINKLRTPKNDVYEVSKILENHYGFRKPHIVDNPRNYDELISVLDGVKNEMKENDNLLIYYAGHGKYEGQEGFWVLKDGKLFGRTGTISVRDAVNDTLRDMKAKHILVVSDSCYSGAILNTSRQVRGASIEYYMRINQKKSRTALTSGGIEPVSDNDPQKNNNHSIFTNGFLLALKDNSQSIFTVTDKFQTIKNYVTKGSMQGQTPKYGGIKKTSHTDGGDFIFVDRRLPPPPIPTPTRIIDYKKQGDIARNNGETSKAMSLYQQSCNNNNAKGCAALGSMYVKQGDRDRAEKNLDKACSLGLKSACAFFKK